MKKIIRHIEYLVSRNDCVIIPGFGAFLAHYESARIDASTGMFLPPRRELVFNQQLDTADTMIAASIARADLIEIEEAKAIVTAEVDALKRTLCSGYTIKLGALGEIKIGYDCQSIIFEPTKADTFSASTLWLTAVQLTALPSSTSPARVPIRHHSSYMRRAVRIAASIALLIGVCFLASTPLTIDDAAMASLAPELKSIETDELLPPPSIPDEDLTNTAEYVTATEADDAQADPAIIDTNVESANVESANTGSVDTEAATADASEETYLVVVATVSAQENAEQFIKSHKGEGLNYEKRGKYYSVYSGEYSQFSKASEECIKARQKYADAWILTKHQ